MKKTLTDHKNEILRYEEQAKHLRESVHEIMIEAVAKQERIEELESVIARRKEQIIEAVLRGKDGFESDRFMRTKRTK
jgi:hypothetical protein